MAGKTHAASAIARNVVDLVTSGQLAQAVQVIQFYCENGTAPSADDFIVAWQDSGTPHISRDFSMFQALVGKTPAGRHIAAIRFNATQLRVMSEYARSQRINKIAKGGNLIEAVETYREAYNQMPSRHLAFFAHDALTPNEFELCVYSQKTTINLSWPACPACSSQSRRINPDVARLDDYTLMLTLVCESCHLPQAAKVRFTIQT